MNKITVLIFALSISSITLAQTTIGATGGFLNVSGTIDVEGNEINNEDRSGGFLGVVVDFDLSEKFHFQPELLYARNNDYGLLMIPLIAKYFPVEKFNVQLGPQIDYSTDPYPIGSILGFAEEGGFDINEDDFSRLGISLAAGLGYDINEHFFVESRYTFQVNDVYTGDLNISIKGHILNVGLGYIF